VRAEPKTFHPLLVTDEPSETVRYLTSGVLIRLNRVTQELEPELAVSWKTASGGRQITFQLRDGVSFSDGAPFSAEDVAFTLRAMMDPNLRSPMADSFGPGPVRVEVSGTARLTVTFPAPVAGLERLFDQVSILSAQSPKKEMAGLGPFLVAEHQPGSHLRLTRNPNYWKREASGRRLPYLDSIRLDIQQNRETEMLRFRRGQIHLINNLDPELFERLAAETAAAAQDAGVSLESEQLWFNQVARAPLAAHKKTWFRSRNFRAAVSQAIQRQDICHVVFRGRAMPAPGPVSPANRFWFNAALKPAPSNPAEALRRLQAEGFELQAGLLRDRQGNPVEFSVITNSGNRNRERVAAMIQQDLKPLGIRLNVVTLDFPSLLERITRNFQYEACLLGLVNVDLDPSAQMNFWLSSASNHPWNPNQKSPETLWEAEIDRLMRAQAAAVEPQKRKGYFDEVQQIAVREAPSIDLVFKNALAAVSPALRNVTPAVLRPQTYWNVERIYFAK
jgi:peptide/nickel transport system substrate-binding protein